MSARAVFLDRDGVINALVPDTISGRPESPLRVEDVTLVDGAADGLARLARNGWMLIGVSNQPAAAKGRVTVDELRAVQDRVLVLLAAEGVRLADFRLCLHHPNGAVAELAGPCPCRKPAPGMLLAAADELDIALQRSWMVGDTDADTLAGNRAGCRTVLVLNGDSEHKRAGAPRPDRTAVSLSDAATQILRAEE